jgi:tetratricopeptide (TPR) repeat protein
MRSFRVRLGLCAAALLVSAASASAQGGADTARLGQAGWDALNAGQTRRAAEAFEDALTRDRSNTRLLLGAGLAAYLERRDEDAHAFLERALQIDRDFADAQMLMGRVLYRRGDLAGAIRIYEALVAGDPAAYVEEARVVDGWRREQELQGRLQQRVGNFFTVSFQGPSDAALADRALEELERAYWRIGGELQTYPIYPIPVVLYTTEQFNDITRSPSWAAGSFDGTIRIPMRGALDDPDELSRVLAHEFTHALVRTVAPSGVPTWLSEGLAAALELDDIGWTDEYDGIVLLPLELLDGPFARLSPDEAALAYATSAIAVRRLLDRAGGVALTNLLRDLGEGDDFAEAFPRRMPFSFYAFQAGLTNR